MPFVKKFISPATWFHRKRFRILFFRTFSYLLCKNDIRVTKQYCFSPLRFSYICKTETSFSQGHWQLQGATSTDPICFSSDYVILRSVYQLQDPHHLRNSLILLVRQYIIFPAPLMMTISGTGSVQSDLFLHCIFKLHFVHQQKEFSFCQ